MTPLVTGAARGIGRTCAEALAAGDANVVLLDVARQLPDVPHPLATTEDLASTRAAIEAHGVRCIAVSGDVRNLDIRRSAVNRAMTELEGLVLMVANANVTRIGTRHRLDEDVLTLVLSTSISRAS